MADATAKADEALQILEAVGFPLADKTPRMRRRLAHVLLAVGNVRPDTPWRDTAAWEGAGSSAIRSRGVIDFINEHYGEQLSSGSYDDVRRKNLDFLVAAQLVIPSAGRPDAATNDGTRGYAIAPTAAPLFRTFGLPEWEGVARAFVDEVGSLAEHFARRRGMRTVPVTLPDGAIVELKAGKHNELQKAIVEEFLPRFAPGATVLYVGDSHDKALHKDATALATLGFFELTHDRLPDVVAHDAARNWLFLVEAVHSSNPIDSLRHKLFENAATRCSAGIVYVSAFRDRAAFAKYAKQIDWETEVWIADSPEHMIHFNGDKFLGPHASRVNDPS